MMSDEAARIEDISPAVQRFLCETIISQMLVSRGILDAGCWITQAEACYSSVEHPVSSVQKVQKEIAGMDLSGLPFEILSDIYESYLSRKLIVNSAGELEYLPENRKRKGKGIYYTPRYIVRYIVDRTLGKYLWGTESGRPEGNMPAKTPEEVCDLRILDPACGSGSFLTYAFDVLTEFYAWHSSRNIGSACRDTACRVPTPPLGTGSLPIILENHLHGIDLDSDAVDITNAILTLKALERVWILDTGCRYPASGIQHPVSSIQYCPNIRQGNFLISGSSAPPDLRQGDKDTRKPGDSPPRPLTPSPFPPVPLSYPSDDGGFAMILGNPPYGARFTRAEREVIRSDYETCRSSDSSSLFIERAVKMLEDNGVLGFIVPKSLSYVVSWRPIREFILNECRIVEIADASKAFRSVRLEQMVVIAQKRGKKKNARHETSDLRHESQGASLKSQVSSLKSSSDTVVSVLRSERSVVSHSIDNDALSAARFSIWLSSRRIRDILDKIWEKSVPLGHLAEIWSGLNARPSMNQYPVSSIEHSARPCLRGRDIQRYHIRPGVQYIKIADAVKHQHPSLEIFSRPKIIAQDIVAHIQNPKPHIKLTATIDRSESWLNLNTVTNIASSEYHLEYLCGILNSRLISWYAYDFIYNRAIRTMHFRRGYADHIPIRRIDRGDAGGKLIYEQLVECVNEMIALYEVEQPASLFLQRTAANNEIAGLDRKIDELIYRLYGLADEDIRFLREHAGL